jgi:hypothetical protein
MMMMMMMIIIIIIIIIMLLIHSEIMDLLNLTQNSLDGGPVLPRFPPIKCDAGKTRKHPFHELDSNSQPQG